MTDLEKLRQAVASLEKLENTYLLDELIAHSELPETIVFSLLKVYWIDVEAGDENELEIVNLELTSEQEENLDQF